MSAPSHLLIRHAQILLPTGEFLRLDTYRAVRRDDLLTKCGWSPFEGEYQRLAHESGRSQPRHSPLSISSQAGCASRQSLK